MGVKATIEVTCDSCGAENVYSAVEHTVESVLKFLAASGYSVANGIVKCGACNAAVDRLRRAQARAVPAQPLGHPPLCSCFHCSHARKSQGKTTRQD